MQPFGLLNFLQTLLNTTQQNPDNSVPPQSQENTENTPPERVENSETACVSTDNQQAILSFFDAHEKRAKNLRK